MKYEIGEHLLHVGPSGSAGTSYLILYKVTKLAEDGNAFLHPVNGWDRVLNEVLATALDSWQEAHVGDCEDCGGRVIARVPKLPTKLIKVPADWSPDVA